MIEINVDIVDGLRYQYFTSYKTCYNTFYDKLWQCAILDGVDDWRTHLWIALLFFLTYCFK